MPGIIETRVAHTFRCEEINLNSGIPTRVKDLSGVDLEDGHGEFLQENTVHFPGTI